jgi:hypothetical protein
MIDINTPILKAYYNAINGLGIPVYEGEEPDDVLDKIYVVVSDVSSNDVSTKSSFDFNCNIQLSINSWEYKYVNSSTLNTTVGQILNAIKPDVNSVFDLTADGLQMTDLKLSQDITQRLGILGERKFITRILIFTQNIFIL